VSFFFFTLVVGSCVTTTRPSYFVYSFVSSTLDPQCHFQIVVLDFSYSLSHDSLE
jgi:hypothetical protein